MAECKYMGRQPLKMGADMKKNKGSDKSKMMGSEPLKMGANSKIKVKKGK